MNMVKISVIIPAYNEAEEIKATLDRIVNYFSQKGLNFEVIVVDDGSGDQTKELVKEKMAEYEMVRLLSNGENRGKGFSVRRGALEATGEWILFMDADLSTTPEEFEKFLEPMKNHDIVIGSRAAPGAEIKIRQPILRELAGRFFNKIVRFYLGLPYHDTQCGFKCFNKKAKILFEGQKLEGWVFDVELLYLAKKFGFKVAEAPITWVNDPTSTVKPSDFFSILRDLRTVKKTWSNFKN